MHPADCPEWEYDHLPDARTIVRDRLETILHDLRNGILDTRATSKDTRPVHLRMFDGLTPEGHDYFAGHYRGEDFRCLKFYEVGIASDSQVGSPARQVPDHLSLYERMVDQLVAALDTGMQIPDTRVPRPDKILYTVSTAARIFEFLLRIHPFANGNGHAARYVVLAILGRYELRPKRWTIEPRPSMPGIDYASAIAAHRRGRPEALESFILECLS